MPTWRYLNIFWYCISHSEEKTTDKSTNNWQCNCKCTTAVCSNTNIISLANFLGCIQWLNLLSVGGKLLQIPNTTKAGNPGCLTVTMAAVVLTTFENAWSHWSPLHYVFPLHECSMNTPLLGSPPAGEQDRIHAASFIPHGFRWLTKKDPSLSE